MSYDSNFSSVSLLLHCNGSDGATTVPDSSSLAHTVTCAGNAQLDTAQAKWGTASFLFDGTNDYATVPYQANLHLSNQDFTVELWVRSSASSRQRPLLAFGTSGGTYAWQLSTTSGGYLQLIVYDDSGSFASLTQSSGSGVAEGAATWYHVAITRSGSTWRVFVDGTLVGSLTSSIVARASASGPSYRLVIGASASGAGGWIGWLDDIRITAGVARYTASFSAPTAEFPDSAPPTEVRVAADGPLAAPAVLGAQSYAMVSADGPLVAGAVLASLRNAYVTADSPLGAPSAIAAQSQASMAADGPLGVPAAQAHQQFGSVSADGPLHAAAALIEVRRVAQIAVSGPLGAPAARAWQDFTGRISARSPNVYVMDLVTPGGLVRVPVSSWQATLQTDAACYVQCVVPAVSDWVDDIDAATEFVISRVAELTDGSTLIYEMARAPVQTVQYAQGPANHTATISGYSDALTPDENPPAAFDRTLRNVRSVFSGSTGGMRVRCEVDWLLRPGHRAYFGAQPILVDYINYYVPGIDQYMDVGERA